MVRVFVQDLVYSDWSEFCDRVDVDQREFLEMARKICGFSLVHFGRRLF